MEHDRRLPDELVLPAEAARGLSPALRDLQAQLLLYKSVFVGEWYRALLEQQESENVRRVLRHIGERAVDEALQLVAALQDWEGEARRDVALEEPRRLMRSRLLRDLLDLKEAATESVVLAAMAAPTAELRDRLVRLADEDRRNGDMLRELLDITPVDERTIDAGEEGEVWGAHGEGAPGDLVSTRIRRTIDALRSRGEEPRRIVMSGAAVRHLRDEGLVERAHGSAFGLPVTIDFGWRGECFAVLTSETANLAELYTAARTGAGVPDAAPE